MRADGERPRPGRSARCAPARARRGGWAAPRSMCAASPRPADLVSAADHASEEAIVALLRAERPDDAILGEEGASVGAARGAGWSTASTAR